MYSYNTCSDTGRIVSFDRYAISIYCIRKGTCAIHEFQHGAWFPKPYRFQEEQGFNFRPGSGNRRVPVLVYRSGLAGYRSEPVEFKFEFKWRSSTGSYRYTGRLDRFTGRFDRFDRWAFMGRPIFFLFLF